MLTLALTPPSPSPSPAAAVELLRALATIRCYDSVLAVAQKHRCQDLVYAEGLLGQEPA